MTAAHFLTCSEGSLADKADVDDQKKISRLGKLSK